MAPFQVIQAQKWRRGGVFTQLSILPQKQLLLSLLTSSLALYSTSSPETRKPPNGENAGKNASHGEEMGKLLNANQPIIKPRIKPSSLLI